MEDRPSQMYCLESSTYPQSLTSGLIELLQDEHLTDVTLGCEGKFIQAHRVVLALSSPFFKEFLRINRVDSKVHNPLILLANVKFHDLRNIVQFMYHGKVEVSNNELEGFLDAAKTLQIQELTTELSLQTTQGPRVSNFDSDISKDNAKDTANTTTDVDPSQVTTSTSIRIRPSTKNSYSPTILNKRPRMTPTSRSTSIINSNVPKPSHQSSTTQPSTLPPSIVPDPAINFENQSDKDVESRSASYDPLNDQSLNEEEDEEMISLDSVKAEHIEVYDAFRPNDNPGGYKNPGSSASGGPSGSRNVSGIQYTVTNTSLTGAKESQHHSDLFCSPSKSGSNFTNKSTTFTDEYSNTLDFVDNLVAAKSQSQMVIQCKICNVLMTQDHFNSLIHACVRPTETGIVAPVTCPICNKTLKNPNSLKVHKSTQHKKPREALSPVSSGIRLKHLVEVFDEGENNFASSHSDGPSPVKSRVSFKDDQHQQHNIQPHHYQYNYYNTELPPVLPKSETGFILPSNTNAADDETTVHSTKASENLNDQHPN